MYKKIFKTTIILVFVIANMFLVFPFDAVINVVQDAVKDSKIVDVLYWSSKDSRVIDSALNKRVVDKVDAAGTPPNGFYIQTGQFVGNNAPKKITGLGFSPDLIILKPDTTAGAGAIFKTKAMPQLTVPYFIATADTVAGAVILDPDGFTANTATTNTVNVTHTWIAFGGSNCTSTGVFCVGEYTGDGASTKTITTGFQPDLVWVKRSTAVDGNWRSSSMGTNVAQYFSATTQETTGVLFTTLNATSFTVGLTNNASAGIYYYVAFKNVTGALSVGTYTGSAADNRNITGAGFVPNFVFLKNANAGTPVSAVYNITDSYGDKSSLYTDSAAIADSIQALQSDGFQVGTHATANGSGNTIYWAAFGGAANMSSGSGTFKSATGTYTGSGQNEIISNLDFAPDLVIIKGNTTQESVFRTRVMGGDSTAYLGAATANLAGAIISLNNDGFTIGTNAVVNSSGLTYYWSAYGNAWNAEKNSGSADFYIGAYSGNGIDNRNITRLPFQANMVTVKRSGATAGTFRTSAMSGDLSGFFAATAEANNTVQALNSDGFQVGTTANVNSLAEVYWYFGFKNGSNFAVGTYSGTGATLNVTGPGFQPDNIWVKAIGATRGVMRNSSGATDSALPFINVAALTAGITAIISTGFTVGTAAETNTSGTNNYRYVVWKNNYNTISTPAYAMQTGYFMGNGAAKSITGLGFSADLIIIKSDTTATGTLFKTKYMPLSNTALFIATADVATGIVNIDNDGFTVSGVANSANVRYTWIAFEGSDCSASGVFCTRAFIGNGTSPRAITGVGFQPNLAIVKQSTAVGGNWRSSSMGSNVGQFFAATVQDTTGILFTTLDATGFTVGSTNNTASGIFYYIAFKSVAGSINVGTYTGNVTDNRNITGVGFVPDFMFLKNANAGTAVAAVMNSEESNGDYSSLFSAAANLANSIQLLQTDGFQVGSDSTSNGSGNTIFYAAFGGSGANSSGTGSFKMASGTYTGTGNYKVFDGLDFSPDLIIIKGNTTQESIFRTKTMTGDTAAYLGSATANFTNGVIAINVDGFTIGTDAKVNSATLTYYWVAYGNAWNPDTDSGSSDFYIGAYSGNAIDNTNIVRQPFTANMVTVKRNGASAGTFRTSAMASNVSAFFAATAEGSGQIKTLNADGFTVGTGANVNTLAAVNWFFGFKTGSNFAVGTYSGTGSSQTITAPGFRPDNLWVKSTGATRGVMRTTDGATDSALPFINVAALTAGVTALTSTGFTVNTAAETNTSGSSNYRFVAWRKPSVTVSATGTQTSSMSQSSTNNYVGGAFTFVSNISSINITSLIISEVGTIAADTNLSNVKLYYETAGTCTYNGTETQFGTTQSFNASQEATFTGALNIDTSQVCVYAVLDVAAGASNGDTIEIEITASTDIVLSTGVVTGTFATAISGTTTISGGTISVGGSCKQFNQSSNCADSQTVKVAFNGTLQAQTATTSSGTFSVTGLTGPAAGDVITVFLDGVADSNEAVAVSKYNTGNVTGMLLYEKHLTIGSADNQTITNANLSQYDNSVSGDEDIFFEVNAGNDLTVDYLNQFYNENLYIKASNTYRPDSASSGDVTTYSLQNDGILTADSNNINVSGNWTNNSTFNANSSTVNLTGTVGDLTSNQSGYWKMDEATWGTPDCSTSVVLDSSGNNYNGTACPASTGPTGAAIGKLNLGGDFDGTNDVVQVADNANLRPTGDMTVSAWIKLDTLPTTRVEDAAIAFKSASGAPSFSLYVSGSSNKPFIKWQNDSTTMFFASYDTALVINTWYHIVGVHEGNNLKFYFNGSSAGTISATTTGTMFVTSPGPLRFGASTNPGTTERLDGQIDEVRIFSRALSVSDIQSLYSYAPVPSAYWKLDENAGIASVRDSSGNNKIATMNTIDSSAWSTGKFASALNLDGSSDYLSLPSPGLPTRDFTYESWVYLDANTDETLFAAMDGSAANELLVYVTATNKLQFQIDSAGTTVTSTNSIATSTWTHVAVTREGSLMTIYLNGVADPTTGTDADALAFSTCTLLIGVDPDNAASNCTSALGNYLDGKMDDIKIYNYARSAAQIGDDMFSLNNIGTTQTLTGATTFYNLISTTSTGKNLKFTSGQIFGINNNLTLTGTNCTSLTTLRATTLDSSWSLDDNAGGTTSVNYVNVRDSNAVDQAVTAARGVNSGGNTNWTVTASCGFDTNISGVCKQVDQTTNCPNSETVKVAVNGVLQAQTTTTSSGTFTISSVMLNPTDILTVFIDNVVNANEAVAVTKFSGANTVSGVLLYEGHLTIGSDDNQTITNTNISLYDNSVSADEDIFVDVSSGALTVDSLAQYSAVELYIKAGNTFAPGGNVTTSDLKIDGTYSGGTETLLLTAAGTGACTTAPGTIRPLCINSGTFTPGTNTTRFTANTITTIQAATYYNLELKPSTSTALTLDSGTFTINGNLTVGNGTNAGASASTNNPTLNIAGDITIATNATFTATSGTFEVGGNWINNGTFTKGTGTVTFDGNVTASNGPIGYWQLDEQSGQVAYDSSPNKFNGNLINYGTVNPVWKPGNTGTALQFGNTNAVDFGTTNLGLSGDNAYTIAAWVKPSATFIGDACVFSYGGGSGGNVISLCETVGGNIYSVHYGNDHAYTATWTPNVWQHVAITYDPTTSTESLYINGAFQESWTPSNLSLSTSAGMAIGSSTWNGVLLPDTTVDDVRVYNYARTLAQVGEDKNGPFFYGQTIVSGCSSEAGCTGKDFYNVIINKPTSTDKLYFSNNPVRISHDLTLTQGTIEGNSMNLEVANDFSSAGVIHAPFRDFIINNNFTISGGSFTHNSGTVVFGGTTNSTLSCNSVTFNLVKLTHTSGTKTVNSNCSLPLGAAPTAGSEDILANWKFDENTGTTINDSGPNNFDGSLTFDGGGSNPTWTTGQFGSALSFGNLGYVDVGSPTLGLSGDAAYTIEAWVKPFAFGGTDTCVFSQGGPSYNNIFSMCMRSDGSVYAAHYGTDSTFDTTYQTSTWQHVTLTYDPVNSAEKLYINGVLTESRSPDNLSLGSYFLWLGKGTWAGFSDPLASTVVDDVRLYNYARTPDQILIDMNNAYTGTPTPSITLNGTISGTGKLTTMGTLTMNSGSSLSGFSDLDVTDLTVAGATANFGSYTTFTSSGTVTSSSGSLTVPADALINGALTVNGGTFTGSSPTIGGTITASSGTLTLTTDADLNGNVTISGATFVAPSGTMTVAGNFSRTSGTFTHSSGTVDLDGTNQSISGSTTFNNLSKTETTAYTLTFAAGTTQTILGTTTFEGASSNQLSLVSSSPGTNWNFDPQGTRNITYVTPSYSTNSNVTIIATSGNNILDGGQNYNWDFGPTTPNIPMYLEQMETDNTPIPTASWIDVGDVKFSVSATDLEPLDSLQLCIEKDLISNAFSNTEDSCASGVAYTGTPVTLTHTITGIADGDYHWQARIKDLRGGYSPWIEYKIENPTNDGLIGHWRFDEKVGDNINDSSPSGIDGVLTPGPCICNKPGWNPDSRLGSGLTFAQGYVDFGTPTLGLTGDAAYSISAWIKPHSLADDTCILSYGEQNNSRILSLCIMSGNVYVVHWGANDHSYTGVPYIIDVWQHITVTYDPTTSTEKVYLNGQEMGSTTISNLDLQASGTLQIGMAFWNNGLLPWSEVDDVRVYNKALSASEADDLYSLKNKTNIEPDSPVAYWKFDENTGSTANDSSGNGFNATFSTGNTSYVTGKYNYALSKSFVGDGANVAFSSSSALDFGTYLTSGYTVAFWFKTGSNINSTLIASSASNGISINTNTYAALLVYDGNGNPTYYDGAISADNQWHHYAVVYYENYIHFYKDGVRLATKIIYPGWTTGAGTFYVGGISADPMDGALDDVRVYGKALRYSEIAKLYNFAPPNGWWKMDEANWGTPNCSTAVVLDSSGSANNGKACPNSTGPTGGAAGKFEKAGNFDGSNDYVEMPSKAIAATDNWAMSAWVKPNTLGAGFGMVAYNGDDSAGYGFGIGGDNGGTGSKLIGLMGSVGWINTTYTFPSANTWYHVVMTRVSGTTRFYVNGSVQATTSASTPNSPTNHFTVSAELSGGSPQYQINSAIDDVRTYAFGLSGTQVSDIYTEPISYDYRINSASIYPTGGVVYDGSTAGVDITFNNGSLSAMSANWDSFDFTGSALSEYQYSIGTTAGATDIRSWTSVATSTSVNATGLTLQSAQLYFFNVKAINAMSNELIVSSNGQYVAPTLSFSLSSTSITFDNLNNSNSFSNTKTSTITTSTNAYNGYTIRLYKTDSLRSVAYPATVISDYSLGSYGSPSEWTAGNYGFGYTSNDTSIQGSNKFGNSPCPGTGNAPCYAPFSSTAPGDIVADHTANVSGTPITNEAFIITYKVQVPSTQRAGPYTTTLVYTIAPQY